MKSLIVALLLVTTSAQAGVTKWANISCSEGISTRDNKTFTWLRQDDTRTKCRTYSKMTFEGDISRVLICADGTTPMMAALKDGHIVWNHVDMWNPADNRNGVCD